MSVTAGGKAVPLKEATASGPNPTAAAAAIDGDPQTGWSINGGQGQAHSAVFRLAAPLDDAGDLVIQLLFERYHAAGLGRFRISVTTDPRPVAARDTPAEIEELLLTPDGATDTRTEGAAPPALPDGRAGAGQGAGGHRTAPERACRRIPRPWSCKSGRRRTRGRPSSTTGASTSSRPSGSSPPCSRSCPACPRTSLPTGWLWPAGSCRPTTRCPVA